MNLTIPVYFIARDGVEPPSSESESDVMPLYQRAEKHDRDADRGAFKAY